MENRVPVALEIPNHYCVPETTTVPIADIIFRQDLYPRIKHSPETVQKYAEDLSVLPPIEVNQHNELIDGWHRFTAHRQAEATTILVFVTVTNGDTELLELAIERNATHGLQLSQEDKRDMARRIYHETPERDREAKKKRIAKIMSVSERTVREWLSRIDKDAKEARDKRIYDLWLQCYTQEQIAEREYVTHQQVANLEGEFANFGKLAEICKVTANHITDFEAPLYGTWNYHRRQQT